MAQHWATELSVKWTRMTRLFLATLASFLVLGCNSARSDPQAIGGVDFKLVTVPNPPRAGRIQLEVTVTEDGKPLKLVGLTASISDATRMSPMDQREVILNPKGDKLVGFIDLYPGDWHIKLSFLQGGQERSETFVITVKE